jgi:hypothetical protein
VPRSRCLIDGNGMMTRSLLNEKTLEVENCEEFCLFPL